MFKPAKVVLKNELSMIVYYYLGWVHSQTFSLDLAFLSIY